MTMGESAGSQLALLAAVSNGEEALEGNVGGDLHQTMRTLANNMAWMLKKLHGIPTTDQPEREDWEPMNFIR